MANPLNQIVALTGLPAQLSPASQQPVLAQLQTVTQPPMPLILVALPELRSPYIDQGYVSPAAYIPGVLPATPGTVASFRLPAVVVNRYQGGDQIWQILAEWDIPAGLIGNVREIALQSSDDAHTRYRIFLANLNQNIPTDRQTSTPLSFPFPDNDVPGGTSVRIDVQSTDGTNITVDGMISGVLRTP